MRAAHQGGIPIGIEQAECEISSFHDPSRHQDIGRV